MQQALIIIDVQNDYFPGGRQELYRPKAALAEIKKVLQRFRARKEPIFFIQHISLGAKATFFLPDTVGAELHPDLVVQEGEQLVVKHYPNSFLKTDLTRLLQQQGIQQLVICGMMTHMCIDTTVRAAQNDGFAVTLLEDGCAGKELSWHGRTLPYETVHDVMMAALSGTFATIKTTDLYLEEEQ